MTEPHQPESGGGPDPRADGPPGAPRWVKVAGIIVAALVLLMVVVMLLGGGNHGPGRHFQGAPDCREAQTNPPARTSAETRALEAQE